MFLPNEVNMFETELKQTESNVSWILDNIKRDQLKAYTTNRIAQKITMFN